MKNAGELNTLSGTMNKAIAKGFTEDFMFTENGMYCKKTDETFQPEDLTIHRIYRFEGASNPEDMAILYTMESTSGTKGLFVDAFGTYGSYDAQELTEFLKKVKVKDDEGEKV